MGKDVGGSTGRNVATVGFNEGLLVGVEEGATVDRNEGVLVGMKKLEGLLVGFDEGVTSPSSFSSSRSPKDPFGDFVSRVGTRVDNAIVGAFTGESEIESIIPSLPSPTTVEVPLRLRSE